MKNDRAPQEAVGGQAVIEGVMMRTPESAAVAVRRPDGSIAVRSRPWKSVTKRVPPLGWPLLRGVVVLVESLSGGIDALRFSAEVAVDEESPAPSGGSAAALMCAAGDGGAPAPSSRGRFSANLAMLLGFALAIVLFKGVPHGVALLSGLEPTQTLFHVVDGAAKLLLVIGYMAAISRMKDIQRVFQYHGAEHKSIRTFELDQELTVENARGNSRLHPRCGTSFIVVVVLASMAVYIALSPLVPRTGEGILFQLALVGAKILLLAPVAAISYEINRMAGKYWTSPVAKAVAWPGMLMQRLLTTREPDDDQLEVALLSLGAALRLRGEAVAEAEKGWKFEVWRSYDEFREAPSEPDLAGPAGSPRAA